MSVTRPFFCPGDISRTLLVLLAFLTLGACSHYSKIKERPMSAVAVTSEQKALYKSLKPLAKQPAAQLGRYIDEADHAWQQLIHRPEDEQVRSNYNFAVARMIGIIEEHGLTPWEAPLACPSGKGDSWSLTLQSLSQRPEHNPSRYNLLPADRFTFKGKLVGERNIKAGLGAPLIAVAKGVDFKTVDRFDTEDEHLFYGVTAVLHLQGRQCRLQLIDPLSQEDVTIDKHTYPLAADFQAPLAMALASVDVKKAEISGMFRPAQYENSSRLAFLQPYHPGKIPVLFVHGLGNSPATWAPMIDHLRKDASIRERYQFWFFSYPTGLPYPMNAVKLRKQLERIRKSHPHHKDIVIVAHSLGGNITRLLISDSGMKMWDTYFSKPPAEIPLSDETLKRVSGALLFKPQPHISRVIFASASLRGSNVATSFIGKLGSKIIGDPIHDKQVAEEILAYARPEIRAMGREHLPNSVEMLNPENLYLNTVNTLPISSSIPYHSIMGDRGKGGNLNHTKPVSTDGIVPYWSAHLDGAQSEKIIPSHHWTILHPQGMQEIERILLQY